MKLGVEEMMENILQTRSIATLYMPQISSSSLHMMKPSSLSHDKDRLHQAPSTIVFDSITDSEFREVIATKLRSD